MYSDTDSESSHENIMSMPNVRALLEGPIQEAPPVPAAVGAMRFPPPWSADNPHRRLLRVKHLQTLVAAGHWTMVLESVREGTAQFIDCQDQRIIWQRAMQNSQLQFRSLCLFRNLLKDGFPMKNVDAALEVVLQNDDRDTLHDICNFFRQRLMDPSYPHNLPIGTKLRIIKLLQQWPAGQFYLEEATRSLYYYSHHSERFSQDTAKESLRYILHHIHDLGERGLMLWRMFLKHDVLEDAACYLNELSHPRAVSTVSALVSQIAKRPWCWYTERGRFSRLCTLLLDSGLLDTAQTQLLYDRLQLVRQRWEAERHWLPF